MATHEREITEPVDLCTANGRRLHPDAIGWSRHPILTANLRGSWGRNKRWDYWAILAGDLAIAVTYADVDYLGMASIWWCDLATGRTGGRDNNIPGAFGLDLPDLPGTAPLRWSNRRGGVALVDDDGVPLDDAAADDPGEIQIRGRNLFSGYWPDGQDAPGNDGWWSTGDVGFLDADGDLFLVDRVKELIIVSGFNVYPTEVEAVLEDVDGVRQAAVLGVPDPATGEAVVAYVVPDAPGAGDELMQAVRARAEERLAPYKRPARVEVVETLPKTVTGKIRKGVLRGAERRKALGILE